MVRNKCTCRRNRAWENGECDYCLGEYPCPNECGELARDCRCDQRCAECGEFDCTGL